MINPILGFNVSPLPNNQYSVAVNNGNAGAVVMSSQQYDAFCSQQANNQVDNSTVEKVSAQYLGQGQVNLAVTMHKNTTAGPTHNSGSMINKFNNEAAAIAYTNLVNSTGAIYSPVDSETVLEDLFVRNESAMLRAPQVNPQINPQA